jgi:hypothetical protein
LSNQSDDERGREEWPLTFPPYRSVQENLFNLEYAHPAIYEAWFKGLDEGFNIRNINFTPMQARAAVKIGLIKPIFAETSDDEAYILYKLWSALEEEYKWPNTFDNVDLYWLYEMTVYVGRLN